MQFPSYAAEMIGRLREAGFSAYAVGGCVRDSLLGREPNDWDITTSARPQETEAVFLHPRYRVRTGNGLKHGTVTVSLADDSRAVCEITTYRSDGEYSDHRRPDAVRFVSDIREDLSRRDFTVNAMAAAPLPDGETEMVDMFGGREDLAAGILRCVGDPMCRFDEDALRILRGLRFAARYGFTVEARTADGMRTLAPLLSQIAPERIGTELTGILSGTYCGPIIRQFGDILARILPGCSPENAAELLSRADSWILRTALLCRDCAPEKLRGTLMRYALGASVTERILRMIVHRSAPLADHRDLCRLADTFGEEGVREYFAFRMALCPEDPELTESYNRTLCLFAPGVCYNTATLAVDGRMLREAGIPPGPALGRMLRTLTDAVIAGNLPNRREELLAAVQLYAEENK